MPFGEETFSRLTDTYRRIRNTLRILLGNLHGFDPARDAVAPEKFTSVDAWIMHRLGEVVATCREAYAKYEYHRVYHTINQFCAVDLSALYVDITKDRMYCDRADSPRRRATQTVMHQVFGALCRLLAPVLAFTAEEAWGHFGGKNSIHTEKFPGGRCVQVRHGRGVGRVHRKAAAVARENRPGDRAGAAGQADRQLAARPSWCWRSRTRRCWPNCAGAKRNWRNFSSSVRSPCKPGTETRAVLKPSEAKKCARCWRHRTMVGLIEKSPELCDRCADAISTVS